LPKRASRENLLIPLCLFVLALATRVPFSSKMLFHMDSVQFALALRKFDVSLHQPHPPGYFLYVMMGRLLSLLIGDANVVFITISVVFSGLAVVAVYFLGREIFDYKTGLIAAAYALTSPSLWFNGAVALTYVAEAFFSVAVAFLCWRTLRHGDSHAFGSAVVMGLAGGIRQNTTVFLLPLWAYSLKGVSWREKFLATGLLGLVCLMWFVPAVVMTGGVEAYKGAFEELWLFNTGGVSVFEKGLSLFAVFSRTLFDFTVYGVGAAIVILFLASYHVVRSRKIESVDRGKAVFLALWVLPSVLFYLFVFIHPANPGYALIFIPALLLIAAASTRLLGAGLRRIGGRDLSGFLASAVVVFNALFFLLSAYPVSARAIRIHDRDLSIMLDGLSRFDPSRTVVFTGPYIYYGYRHIMHYLPEFSVYQMEHRVSAGGDVRKVFWGMKGETYLAEKVVLPGEVNNFAAILVGDDREKTGGLRDVAVRSMPSTQIDIVSGPVSSIELLYPEMKGRVSFGDTSARRAGE
jgi:hypothetical protein